MATSAPATADDTDSDTDSESSSVAVIEFGSDTTRAGFAGEEKPRFTIPTIIGRPKVPGTQATGSGNSGEDDTKDKGSGGGATAGEGGGEKLRDVYVGDEALSRRGALRLRYPVEWGLVTGWDDFEVMWQDVVQRLGCDTDHTPLLMVEGETMNPKANREKVTQMAFETFRVPAFYLAPSPPLVLGATGRTTGVVVDIAGSVVRAVPVYEGYRLPHAIMKFPFGSRDLTDYLWKLLRDKGALLELLYGTRKEVADMKEKFAYIAQDFEQELSTFSVSQEKQYQLANGETITLGPERFQCAEPLFKPGLIGFEMWGLAEHVVNTVKKCDVDIRQELLSNVVLAGGGSMLPGLASRLQREMERELQSDPDLRKLHVQVLAPPDADLLAWKGASVMASTSSFSKMWIPLDDYEEYGPALVHMRCF